MQPIEVLSGKKRAGKEEIEAGKSKTLKIEYGSDDDDDLYYEGDSDSDSDSDLESDEKFMTFNDLVEGGRWKTPVSPIVGADKDGVGAEKEDVGAEKEDGDRECLQIPLCAKNDHRAPFKGLPVFELYKVRVKLNEKINSNPLVDRPFYGEIVTMVSGYDDDNPDPVSYYRASYAQADTINLECGKNRIALLPLSGPHPRPPLCSEEYFFCLDFTIQIAGQDIFSVGDEHEDPNLFPGAKGESKTRKLVLPPSKMEPRKLLCVSRIRIGDPISDFMLLNVHCSAYYGAWADVEVRLLDYRGDRRVSGLIVARSCIFYSRIRLLTVERPDQKKKGVMIRRGGGDEQGQVGPNGRIKLMRSVVTVPSYSSLIIGALLYEGDGGGRICRGKTCFPAREKGKETKLIVFNGIPTLEVSVQWKCRV